MATSTSAGMPDSRTGAPAADDDPGRAGKENRLRSQFAQVALDAEVRQLSRQDDLVDAALPQLQDEVVGLRAPQLMGADDDGLAVLDEGLVAWEPVGPGAGESVETARISGQVSIASVRLRTPARRRAPGAV